MTILVLLTLNLLVWEGVGFLLSLCSTLDFERSFLYFSLSYFSKKGDPCEEAYQNIQSLLVWLQPAFKVTTDVALLRLGRSRDLSES